jgi:hypothetical protein
MPDYGEIGGSLALEGINGPITRSIWDRNSPFATDAAISEAESLGEDITELVTGLEERAEQAAKDAEAAIKAALQFHPSFDAVASSTPEFTEPTFELGEYGTAPAPVDYVPPQPLAVYSPKDMSATFSEVVQAARLLLPVARH